MNHSTRQLLAKLFGIDPRSLALFRVGLGLLLLGDLAVRGAELTAHYSDAGVVPRSELAALYGRSWAWSLHVLGGSAQFQAVLFALSAVAAAALTLGYRTRLATCVSWALLVSLHVRNPLVLIGGDTLLRLLLFWSMFLPLGETWSLDSRRRPAVRRASPVLSVASASILIQVCLMYWFTAWFKNTDVWRDGFGVYYALSFDAYTRPLGTWLLGYPTLLRWLSRATLAWEALGPLLAFSPVRTGPIRLIVILGFVLLHVGIDVTMTVGLFSYVSLLAWTLFLPSGFWDALPRLSRRVHAADLPRPAAAPLAQIVCAAALAYVVLWNVATANPKLANFMTSPPVKRLGQLTMLQQQWAMFSHGLANDGWCVPAARLKDGRVVDVLEPGQILSWEKPQYAAARHSDHRWRYLYQNVIRNDARRFRGSLCRYLIRHWNDSHPAEQAVENLDLYHVQEITPPPGQTPDRKQWLMHRETTQPRGAFDELLEQSLPGSGDPIPGI